MTESGSHKKSEMTQSQSQNRQMSPTGLRLLAFLLLAHLPFLFVYFRLLFQFDHYSFFPFAIGVFAWLCFERIDRKRFVWTPVCTALVIFDVLMVGAGIAVASSWPVWLGFCSSIAACCLATRELDRSGSLLYLVLPLLILIRPPFAMDLQLVGWLQTKTTWIASAILHRLDIIHFRSGNVLEFADKTLLVEEACSGIQSLFAILFVAAAMIAWQRRRFLQGIVVLPYAFLCAIVFNVVRVLCIAIAWDQFQWDLSSGVSHSILGYICLSLATLMVFSGDQLISLITDPIPTSSIKGFKLDLVDFWNWLFSSEAKSERKRRLVNRPLPHLLRSAMVTGSLAVILFAGQVYAGFIRPDATQSKTLTTTVDTFQRTHIPEQLGDWEQTSYTTETRSITNSFGQYSNSWRYRKNDSEAFVSCDHPFRAWHNLEVCYQGRGWKIEQRVVVSTSDSTTEDKSDAESLTEWPAVEVTFSKPTGEYAYLLYSMFDAGGNIVIPPESSVSASLIDRIFRKSNMGSELNSRTIQSQIFIESPGELSEANRADAIEQHRLTRKLLRGRFQEQVQ